MSLVGTLRRTWPVGPNGSNGSTDLSNCNKFRGQMRFYSLTLSERSRISGTVMASAAQFSDLQPI